MNFLTNLLKQKAVYWASPVADGFGGYTFASPIEILCRWESGNELMVSGAGEEIVNRAKVFVLQDLLENGYLYEGPLSDFEGQDTSNPKAINRAFKIQRFDKIPVVKGTGFFRVAYL